MIINFDIQYFNYNLDLIFIFKDAFFILYFINFELELIFKNIYGYLVIKFIEHGGNNQRSNFISTFE